MKFLKRSSPYTQGNADVSQIMLQVLYALIPGTLLMLWFFGWGLLSNLVLAIVFAEILEWVMLKLRKRPVRPFLSDYSAVVTAWLLAVAMPAYSPWWLIAIAMLFAIVMAKHLYGGLGYNPFNPAMIGYAAVLVSYPLEMTSWPVSAHFSFAHIGLGDTLQQVFGSNAHYIDAYTAATVLDTIKTHVGMGHSIATLDGDSPLGFLAGQHWEWINLAWLTGGIWLLRQRIISWQIPVALLGSLTTIATIFWLVDSQSYTSPLFHLLSGSAMLGAFFIATDPVSASTTPTGKLLYAAGIGLFTYIIRTWGGYPDAIAFSVIIMNMAVPLLDYYTQPRVYGTK